MSSTLGTKRGRGRGSFIDSVLTAVDGFYAEVLGSLRAWSAAPPKLRTVHPEPPELDDTVPVALASTDYSSQDGTEESSADSNSDHEHSRVAAVAEDEASVRAAALGEGAADGE